MLSYNQIFQACNSKPCLWNLSDTQAKIDDIIGPSGQMVKSVCLRLRSHGFKLRPGKTFKEANIWFAGDWKDPGNCNASLLIELTWNDCPHAVE